MKAPFSWNAGYDRMRRRTQFPAAPWSTRFAYFRKQLGLLQLLLANDELAGKSAALFDVDRARDDVAVERSCTADGHYSVGRDLARHPAADLNRADLELSEKLHIGFSSNQDFGRGQFSLHLRGGAEFHLLCAVQAAAQLPLDDCGTANDAAAAQVAGGGHVHLAVSANGAAKGGVDAVIAQVHVHAARGTNGRSRGRIQLLRHPAIEAGDGRDPRPIPNPFEALEKGLRRGDAAADIEGGPGRRPFLRRHEMLAALAAHCAARGGIFHLLKAAVWTIHTDFGRRLSHRPEAAGRLLVRRDPTLPSSSTSGCLRCANFRGGYRRSRPYRSACRSSLRICR